MNKKFTILSERNILSLFDSWLRVDQKKRTIAFWLYGHVQTQEPLPLGSRNLQLGGLLIGHHYYVLSLSKPCPILENFLKKYTNFTLFTSQLPSFWMEITKFTISCVLVRHILHTIVGNDWPGWSSGWAKTTDANHSTCNRSSG